MPYGTGTYGSKVGRPPAKKKAKPKKKQLSDERTDTRWQGKYPTEDRSEKVFC